MSRSVPFVLIGAGGIAQSHAQAFAESPDAKLVAVVDTRPEAAQALAEPLGAKAFTSLEAFFAADMTTEAALVCSPPNTHEPVALSCLRHGLHVLCEKPFALTPGSARRMTAAAREANKVITMASKFRHVEDVVRAKSLIASGVLGEVVLAENAFTSRIDMARRWHSDPEISGGGVLMDNGTHSLDLMRYLFGPLSAFQVVEVGRPQMLKVEDTVRVFARSESGVPCSIDLSWSIDKELSTFLNVYGTRGTLQVGWRETKLRGEGRKEWEVFGRGYEKLAAFRSVLHTFARHLSEGSPLLIDADDAVASVDAVEAAYRALSGSHWEKPEGGH